jgi:hypothetical protein
MPGGCRAVLLLCKVEMLSHPEIAARLGIAVSTVEKQHARAFRLEQGTLRVFVDIFNAYDRENKVGFDDHYAWVERGQLNVRKTSGTMLPLLPSAGVSWEF